MRIVIGIDIGSTVTKGIVINESKEILATKIMSTPPNMKETAYTVLNQLFEKISLNNSPYIVTTGYGRNCGIAKNKAIPEIIAIAEGILYLNPKIKSIIDVGGQDSKIIKLNNQRLENFKMNDMCAAGTGKFIENMAKTFKMNIEEFIQKGLSYKDLVKIDSTCAVFAESEVITKLAQNKRIEDIIASIHLAVVKRLFCLASSLVLEEPLALSGGVAKNKLFIHMIKKEFQKEIFIPSEPQITGALGAALVGLKDISKNHERIIA